MTDKISEDLLNELAADLQANPPNENKMLQTQISLPVNTQLNNDENIEEFINNSTQQSAGILLQVIQKFSNQIGDDPDRASALSELIKGHTNILNLLNQQIIKNRDNQTKIEIQKLKEQGNIIQDVINNDKTTVVCSRDEMFKQILDDAQDVDLVDDEEEEEN